MKRRARGPAEPAQILHAAPARHDPDEGLLVGLEDPVRTAGLHSLEVRSDGEHRKDHVLFGHDEVMHERGVGDLEPLLVHQLAVLVRDAVRNVTRSEAIRLVAEEVHVPRFRIEPRVSGHRLAAQLAAIVPLTERLERARMNLHRTTVFLQRKQTAAVEDRRRVVHGARLAAHARIVRVRVPVKAVERAPRTALLLEAL